MTTMEKQKFNGWANKETWNTQVCITNEINLYHQILYLLGNPLTGSLTTGDFAECLKMFLWKLWNGKTPEGDSRKNLDWLEIAMAWQEDNKAYLNEIDAMQSGSV